MNQEPNNRVPNGAAAAALGFIIAVSFLPRSFWQ